MTMPTRSQIRREILAALFTVIDEGILDVPSLADAAIAAFERCGYKIPRDPTVPK